MQSNFTDSVEFWFQFERLFGPDPLEHTFITVRDSSTGDPIVFGNDEIIDAMVKPFGTRALQAGDILEEALAVEVGPLTVLPGGDAVAELPLGDLLPGSYTASLALAGGPHRLAGSAAFEIP